MGIFRRNKKQVKKKSEVEGTMAALMFTAGLFFFILGMFLAHVVAGFIALSIVCILLAFAAHSSMEMARKKEKEEEESERRNSRAGTTGTQEENRFSKN